MGLRQEEFEDKEQGEDASLAMQSFSGLEDTMEPQLLAPEGTNYALSVGRRLQLVSLIIFRVPDENGEHID